MDRKMVRRHGGDQRRQHIQVSSSSSDESSVYGSDILSSSGDDSSIESTSSEDNEQNYDIKLPKPPPPALKRNPKNNDNSKNKMIQNKPISSEPSRAELIKKHKKKIPIKRVRHEQNRSFFRFQRSRKKRSSSSLSPSPSSSSSEPSSKIESQRKDFQRISNSQHLSSERNSSYQESFLPDSSCSNASDDYDHSEEEEEEHYSSPSGDDDPSYTATNERRRRRRRKQTLEDTMRSVTSSMVHQMKRPDNIFLLMAIFIFVMCASAAYFFGVRGWIENEFNGNTDSIENATSVPTTFPSMATSNHPTLFNDSKMPNNSPGMTIDLTQTQMPSSGKYPNAWSHLGPTLYGSNSTIHFGAAVAISGDGNTIAISGSLEDKVTVYDMVNDSWAQRRSTISGPSDSMFGECLSMSDDGKIIAIGASKMGFVQVWAWNDASWIQRGSTIYREHGFGSSLKISFDGIHLIAGSKDKGPVRVFKYIGEDWTPQGENLFVDDNPYNFGGEENSVSITHDGHFIAVGSNLGSKVECFFWDGKYWDQMGSTILGKESSRFGLAVALASPSDGEIVLAVAAPFEGFYGAIHVFDWTGLDWIKREDFIMRDDLRGLGKKMRMSPDAKTILIASNNALLAYDWDASGRKWAQRGGAKVMRIDGDPLWRFRVNDMMIDLSRDAKKVVVGLPDDDDGYLYGNNYGQVHSYMW